MSEPDVSKSDLERGFESEPLYNSTIKEFSWSRVTVAVKDRTTKQPKQLLDNVDGHVKAGRLPSCHHAPFLQSLN